jgi:hypothetical protein
MCIVKQGLEDFVMFFTAGSKSRHSSLILLRALAQRVSLPLGPCKDQMLSTS